MADEINRAPAKVQSALLESMQELQEVTIGESFSLDQPFLVMATKSVGEGHIHCQAQVDEFMLKVVNNYPNKEEEKIVARNNLTKEFQEPNTILNTRNISFSKKTS